MTATSRFTAAIATGALGVVALAGCGTTHPSGDGVPTPVHSTTAAAPTTAAVDDPDTVADTALIDPSKAERVAEGAGATTEALEDLGDPATTFLFLTADGALTAIEAHPADGTRVFNAWTDGRAFTWVESASDQIVASPWRIRAATLGGEIREVADSTALGAGDWFASGDVAPVVFGDRVYFSWNGPADVPGSVATWSAPLTGGEAQLERVGASGPAATNADVFIVAREPDAADTSAWEPGEVRVVPVGVASTADAAVRVTVAGAAGGVGDARGAGDWLAFQYWDAPGGSGGIVAVDPATGAGFTVPPADEAGGASFQVCADALAWAVTGVDGVGDAVYRLSLPGGELTVMDAPRVIRVGACGGESVLWVAVDDGGDVTEYLTAWE